MDFYVCDIVQDRRPLPVLCVVKIGGHFGLAIDQNLFSCQRFEIDMDRAFVVCQVASIVRQAFAGHTRPDARLLQQFDRAPFKDTRADA